MSTSFRTGAGLALLCAGIGVTSWFAFNARSIETSPTTTIEDVPDRFVEILTESPPPAAGETALSAPRQQPRCRGGRQGQAGGRQGRQEGRQGQRGRAAAAAAG